MGKKMQKVGKLGWRKIKEDAQSKKKQKKMIIKKKKTLDESSYSKRNYTLND